MLKQYYKLGQLKESAKESVKWICNASLLFVRSKYPPKVVATLNA